jgi:hypothetical protein
MKRFLIQKINNEIRNDFSFALLEAIRFNNWLSTGEKIIVKYVNTLETQLDFYFKPIHKNYVPIGSVEFVSAFLQRFYDFTPKPINVPKELYGFANRNIVIGSERRFHSLENGKWHIKSNDKIKGRCDIFLVEDNNKWQQLPIVNGEYQYSEYIDIESEWRAFVYKNELVGLSCYSGEFTKFPNVDRIKAMIDAYKDVAPIAYTLDVGIGNESYNTFVIEVHAFFSCGLYSFNNIKLINMFYSAFNEIIINYKKYNNFGFI